MSDAEIHASGARICASEALQDGGPGVRFMVETADGTKPAFAIRHMGLSTAFLNRCAHKLVELDWDNGQFFDTEGRYLVCAVHGALYDPASGECVAGPCRGGKLISVPIRESGGALWLVLAPDAVIK
jgi:nitrite reductase/ring-hydroxylating ferredoxin subunit